MSFEIAFDDVMKTEGGFVHDSSDHGGPTNFGITLATFSDFLGHVATEEDLKNIDTETVKKIYKQNYWDRLKLDQVKYIDLAHLIFDQAVNRGTRRVAEQLQKILNLKQDGIIGPITLSEINLHEPRELLISFLIMSQNSYIKIVESDPTQLRFLSGWIKRTQKFLT